MTLKNVIALNVDLKDPTRIEKPVVTQNDSVVFVLNVFDGGQPFDLSGATAISLANIRRDGSVVVTPGTKFDNEATFEIQSNETAIVGDVNAKAQFYDAEGRVSTLKFKYAVEYDPTGSGYIPSASEQTLIQTVLADGPLRIQEAINATGYANAQGDYAKTQGDYVVAKKPMIDKFTGEQTNLQTQLDTLIIENGTSDAEVLQARGTYPLVKDRLNSVDSQLADIATNVKTYGAKGDGATDDTTAILNCFAYCITNNKLAFFPFGTYIFNPVSDFNCNGMIGQKATIKYNSTFSFALQNKSIIQGIEVKYYTAHVAGNISKLFNVSNKSSVLVENSQFTFDTVTTDGTTLGTRVFRLEKSNGLVFKNVKFNNVANCFNLINSSNVRFQNIEFNNYSGGITSSDNIYDKASWSSDIHIDNLIGKNTKAQRLNIFGWETTYAALLGLYGGKDIYINNVTSEYAVRRVLYCSGGENVNMKNLTLKGLCSLKFSGFVARSYGKDLISDGFRVSNVNSDWDSDITDRTNFDFYFAKNIYLKNITANNTLNAHSLVLQSNVENFHMEDSTFNGGKVFGLIQLQNIREGDSSQGIPNVSYTDYDAYMKNINFRNVKITNYNGSGYVFEALNDIPDNLLRYQNINLDGVRVDNTNGSHKGTAISPTYLCKGLLNVNKVTGLTIDNSSMDGYTSPTLRSVYVGDLSEKVRLRHTDYIEAGSNIILTNFNNLFMSANSEYVIRAKVNDGSSPIKDFSFSVKPKNNSATIATNSLTNFIIEGELTYPMLASLTNGTSAFIIPYDNTWYTNAGLTRPKILGTIDVLASDGDYGKYRINTVIASPNVVVATDSLNIKTDYTVGFLTISTNATSTIDIRDKDATDRIVNLKYKIQSY